MTPLSRLGTILAFDSSARLAGAALAVDGVVVAEAATDTRRTPTEMLLAIARQILDQSGVAVTDCDRFAYSEGPGSFTGLRIGMAAALGLAAGMGRPVVAVPTLEVLAYPFRLFDAPVVPISGHRRGHVYAAAYRWGGDRFEGIMEPRSYGVDALFEEVSALAADRLIFVGDALDSLAERIRSAWGDRASIAGPAWPRAASVAMLALDPERVEWAGNALEGRTPRYLREADARKQRPGS